MNAYDHACGQINRICKRFDSLLKTHGAPAVHAWLDALERHDPEILGDAYRLCPGAELRLFRHLRRAVGVIARGERLPGDARCIPARLFARQQGDRQGRVADERNGMAKRPFLPLGPGYVAAEIWNRRDPQSEWPLLERLLCVADELEVKPWGRTGKLRTSLREHGVVWIVRGEGRGQHTVEFDGKSTSCPPIARRLLECFERARSRTIGDRLAIRLRVVWAALYGPGVKRRQAHEMRSLPRLKSYVSRVNRLLAKLGVVPRGGDTSCRIRLVRSEGTIQWRLPTWVTSMRCIDSSELSPDLSPS